MDNRVLLTTVICFALLATACHENPVTPTEYDSPPGSGRVTICVTMSGEVLDEDGVVLSMNYQQDTVRNGECAQLEAVEYDRDLWVYDVAPHCVVDDAERRSVYGYEFSLYRELVSVSCGSLPPVLEGRLELSFGRSPPSLLVSVDSEEPQVVALETDTLGNNLTYGGRLTLFVPVGDREIWIIDVAGEPYDGCEQRLYGGRGSYFVIPVAYGKNVQRSFDCGYFELLVE